MARAQLFSAVGTPLEGSNLDADALAAHLDDQWDAGVDGVLVAGTMGAMPLLTMETYERLLVQSAELCQQRGALLLGVGDASFARTVERIEVANRCDAAAVVVLTPYFIGFSQSELIDYYVALAKHARAPLLLYDLPQRTPTALSFETIARLAEHPRIIGIKISGDLAKGRRLLRELDDDFTVYFAEAAALDLLLRDGAYYHLDGIYSLVPRLVRAIADAVAAEQTETVERQMRLLDQLLAAVVRYGPFPAVSALLNRRGIAGNFAPAPFAPLTDKERDNLCAEPGVEEAIRHG